VQNFPFGTIMRAFDPIHGFGEFIYLQGIAATVAGSLVNYNSVSGATTINLVLQSQVCHWRLLWLQQWPICLAWYQDLRWRAGGCDRLSGSG